MNPGSRSQGLAWPGRQAFVETNDEAALDKRPVKRMTITFSEALRNPVDSCRVLIRLRMRGELKEFCAKPRLVGRRRT
jgi:hypothetical protein